MFNELATAWFRFLGGAPAFRVYGRARDEPDWRVIDVFATPRRDRDSRWPGGFWRGVCITWTASVVAVGHDFAEDVLREQAARPASRQHPVEVAGGRLHGWARRAAAGGYSIPTASEVLAHECGHTAQARRLGLLYWPLVGAFTRFREGPHFWNRFENQASERGQFGGLVSGSVRADYLSPLHGDRDVTQ